MTYADLKQIEKEDLHALRGKSGIYWTLTQDIENETKILIRRVKNYSVQGMYGLLGGTLDGYNGGSSGVFTIPVSGGYSEHMVYASPISTGTPQISATLAGTTFTGMSVRAGTDTTTPTTISMTDIRTPASPTPNDNTLVFNPVTGGLQWSASWAIGSFGASGTTAMGEFGLCTIWSVGIGMLNRLAVADGNTGFTSPVSVNNLAVFNATITLVI